MTSSAAIRAGLTRQDVAPAAGAPVPHGGRPSSPLSPPPGPPMFRGISSWSEVMMAPHPLAGHPAPAELLVDVGRLERLYYEGRPDPDDPLQRVSFGTSGH